MSLLDKLDRKIGRFAPSHVTLYLIIGQVFVLLTAMMGLLDPTRLELVPLALRGEPWRIFTFIFMPPPFSGRIGLVLLPFSWWLMFLMGNALEHYWGSFRYALFLFVGMLLTIAAAFISPAAPATNWFWMLSISLAFAWLNPEFEILLFFVLPAKMKWLALIAWIYFGYILAVGPNSVRGLVLATAINFGLFFGREITDSIRFRERTRAADARRRSEEKTGPQARHRCYVCGKTDLTNPEMDFRYCSKCAGDQCYCPEHIFNHEHVLTENESPKP
jgi:hypothetical protein